jgi:hypothetical protein
MELSVSGQAARVRIPTTSSAGPHHAWWYVCIPTTTSIGTSPRLVVRMHPHHHLHWDVTTLGGTYASPPPPPLDVTTLGGTYASPPPPPLDLTALGGTYASPPPPPLGPHHAWWYVCIPTTTSIGTSPRLVVVCIPTATSIGPHPPPPLDLTILGGTYATPSYVENRDTSVHIDLRCALFLAL